MALELVKFVRDVPDFPVEGILFKDITPLLGDGEAFRKVIEVLADRYADVQVDQVVAIESRGFILGAPLAYKLGAGFVPVRKPGKLPAATMQVEYSLEYGTNALEMHVDAITPGQKVLLVDDLLATGGSARAAIDLIERLGGTVIGVAFLIELVFLNGIEQLKGYDVFSLLRV
ncbi:MAG: adenine phosphoribosyltransferase [Anaerolineae bacterium]|nr:adenine phosphoribosyltransferase [Anaerolineae bacterium]